MAAMALGLPSQTAMTELRRRCKEILKREGLSPWEIAYLRGVIERRPREYVEAWASGYAAGLAEGIAKGILVVLDVRRLPVPGFARERITSCSDPARLDDWLRRARTVECVEALFSEGAGALQE
ncbi:hypothetical protein [Streptomyces gilvus]|uniref:hypothetical protein n=1 Tax=Streptomyces gilvus TaxID=2920937 RepID=UPI001F0E945B|nr:hypothetical protein [Streptomyces sp. CME 23]MCH5673608.1 hypothetical protein [Streptomyces sp. CME 23]